MSARWKNDGTLIVGGIAFTQGRGRLMGYLTATNAIDPPSIAAGGKTSVTTTVTGAAVGDLVDVQPLAALETGLVVVAARVSAADTVQIDLYNPTAGAIDGISRNWYIVVSKMA